MNHYLNRTTILTAIYIAVLMVMIKVSPLIYVAIINSIVLLVAIRFLSNSGVIGSKEIKSIFLVSLPFLIVPIIWSLYSIVFRWDWTLVGNLVTDGISGKYIGLSLAAIIREYRIDIKSICEVLSLFTILIVARASNLVPQDKRVSFINGVLGGLILVAITSVIFIFMDGSSRYQSNPSFWSAVNRVSGVCTDPNALGIFSFLCIALAFTVQSKELLLKWVVILSYFGLGVVSGSRTFVLGLSMYLILAAISELIRKRKVIFIFSILGLLISTPYIISQVKIQIINDSVWLPEAIKRAAISIHALGFWESIASRMVFWKLTWLKFTEFPVFGVGFNQFERGLSDFSGSLGMNLDGWIDNSNSFYLGILAEQGLVGVLILIIAFCLTRFDFNGINQQGRLSILIFFVLLLFGPHFDFLEVSSIFGVLLGLTFSIQKRISKNYANYIVVLLFGFITLISASARFEQMPFGLFSRRQFIFVRSKARLNLTCNQGIGSVVFSIPGAMPTDNPVEIIIETANSVNEITMQSANTQSFNLPCEGEQLIAQISCTPVRIPNKEQLLRGVRPFCVAISKQNT